MINQSVRILRPLSLLSLLALSASALAQVGVPAPQTGGSTVDGLYVIPNNGQTAAQQQQDRYECHNWATGQTGFDPGVTGGGVPPAENAARRSEYERAMAACLEAHGYTVRIATPVPPAAPPPVAPPVPRPAVPLYGPPPGYGPPLRLEAPVPTLSYHPFDVQLGAGYSVPAGSTHDDLNGGPNVGVGFTWFPSPALPFGVRVDGSWNYFTARHSLLDSASGGPYTYGHESVYGGDADLQLNLEHGPQSRFYVFGGVGEYREHTYLRQVSFETPASCSAFFFCPGYFANTATDQYTTQWDLAWNAGAGWEVAITPRATFFIEARYLQILPSDARMQFVPVSVGFRF